MGRGDLGSGQRNARRARTPLYALLRERAHEQCTRATFRCGLLNMLSGEVGLGSGCARAGFSALRGLRAHTVGVHLQYPVSLTMTAGARRDAQRVARWIASTRIAWCQLGPRQGLVRKE